MSVKETKNISYYNEIANEYDAIMGKERSNEVVRWEVADKFLNTVAPGRVLDFGGGTGGDLGWLTNNYYHVLFCEPSIRMKQLAMMRHNKKIVPGHVEFLSGAAVDFTSWNLNLPFCPPADAVLANFAVINCIEDIALLFKNLALVIRPGGVLIALVLRPKLLHKVRSLAGLGPHTLDIRYKEHAQTVFVHTMGAIRKASRAYFTFSSRKSLRGTVFSLIHLTRK
jgi:SAM-dependent methyltransferase